MSFSFDRNEVGEKTKKTKNTKKALGLNLCGFGEKKNKNWHEEFYN